MQYLQLVLKNRNFIFNDNFIKFWVLPWLTTFLTLVMEYLKIQFKFQENILRKTG